MLYLTDSLHKDQIYIVKGLTGLRFFQGNRPPGFLD